MISSEPGPLLESADQTRLRALSEQIKIVYRMQAPSAAITLGLSALVAVLLRDVGPNIWIWFCVQAALKLATIVEGRFFYDSESIAENPLKRMQWIYISEAFNAAGWASLLFVIGVDVTPFQLAFVILVLGGVLSGGVTTYGALPKVHAVYLTCFGAVSLAAFFRLRLVMPDNPYVYLVPLLVLLYCFAVFLNTRASGNTYYRFITLGFANAELAAELAREVKRVEEARREAEAANEAKSTFLASASHDLRQPIHAVGLFLALLDGTDLAPAQREMLDQNSLRQTEAGFGVVVQAGTSAGQNVDAQNGLAIQQTFTTTQSSGTAATSTAVTTSYTAGGQVISNISGNASMEGTNISGARGVTLQSGSLDFKEARNTTSTSSSQFAVDQSLVIDPVKKDLAFAASGEGGKSSETTSTAVVGRIVSSGGAVNVITNGGDLTMTGTAIEAAQGANVGAIGGKTTLNAAQSTMQSATQSASAGVAFTVGKDGNQGTSGSDGKSIEVSGSYQNDRTREVTNQTVNITSSGGQVNVFGDNVTLQAAQISGQQGASVTARNGPVVNQDVFDTVRALGGGFNATISAAQENTSGGAQTGGQGGNQGSPAVSKAGAGGFNVTNQNDSTRLTSSITSANGPTFMGTGDTPVSPPLVTSITAPTINPVSAPMIDSVTTQNPANSSLFTAPGGSLAPPIAPVTPVTSPSASAPQTGTGPAGLQSATGGASGSAGVTVNQGQVSGGAGIGQATSLVTGPAAALASAEARQLAAVTPTFARADALTAPAPRDVPQGGPLGAGGAQQIAVPSPQTQPTPPVVTVAVPTVTYTPQAGPVPAEPAAPPPPPPPLPPGPTGPTGPIVPPTIDPAGPIMPPVPTGPTGPVVPPTVDPVGPVTPPVPTGPTPVSPPVVDPVAPVPPPAIVPAVQEPVDPVAPPTADPDAPTPVPAAEPTPPAAAPETPSDAAPSPLPTPAESQPVPDIAPEVPVAMDADRTTLRPQIAPVPAGQSIVATTAEGGELPCWLSIDPRTGAIRGRPSDEIAADNVPVIIIQQVPQADGTMRRITIPVRPNQFGAGGTNCSIVRTTPLRTEASPSE